MNERTCAVSACLKAPRARGWCLPHYHRWRRHGDPESHGTRKRASCTICGDPVHGSGMCRLHWSRWRKTGDPQANRPNRNAVRTDGLKWCPGCSRDLPAGKCFARNSKRKDGFNGHCRECLARWRAANGDYLAAGKVTWRAENRARVRESSRINEAIRRVRLSGAGGFATAEQVAARWTYFGNRCWICGAGATVTDHVKPVVAGGPGWASNLRPACGPCNRAKGGAWPYPLEVARARSSSLREAA